MSIQQQNILDAELIPIEDQVKIGISNFRIALEKSQPDPIYKVCLEILKHYNFFNAIIATADAPEIYMQQLWHTVSYDLTAKAHFFKINDQIFELNADFMRNALRITPKDPDHPFTLPTLEKEIISFINKLGCSKIIKKEPRIAVQRDDKSYELYIALGLIPEGHMLDSKARYSSFKLKELDKTEEPKALLPVDSMLNWSDHEGEDVESGVAQVYGMIAGAEEDAAGDVADGVSNAAAEFTLMGISSQAKLEKLDYKAKLEESTARFDKWKDSSKNLDKLIHSSMSSRLKFSLGFGETFGSNEVYDPFAPSIFDTTPEDVAEKHLYDMFVKAVGIALSLVIKQLTKSSDQTGTAELCILLELNNKPLWTKVYFIFPSFVPKASSVPDRPGYYKPYGYEIRRDEETVVKPSAEQVILGWNSKDKYANGDQGTMWDLINYHGVLRVKKDTSVLLSIYDDIKPAKRCHCLWQKPSLVEVLPNGHRRMALGIRRDYSNARTPQQNGVAERKKSKPIGQKNLHAGTLFPNISHLKPFGCLVTILNTSDHLGKFEGKADEGFIVGYAAHSKAPIGTQDTNIHAGTQDDSDSECDEQVIVVPSFPSNSFSGPKVNEASEMMESSSDYAEGNFARIQKQAYDSKHYRLQQHMISVAQALNDPAWVEAMQEEMQQFINQKVWQLVPLPDGKIAIGTKWILKNKRDARGIVVRNKARLVAQGHRQEEGIDYDEVFAPVARIEAIRLFLAFASYMGFMVYQIDVKSAFLYGEIEEEVYVTQPKGFEDPHFPKHVYRVVKALYGLHQAPRAWYARLSTFLLKHNYRRGTIDKTLFIKKNSRDIILVQVYVDDIIFGSTNKAWCDDFEVLMKGEFEMSAMGELTFFLGLQVKQKPDGIFISQDKYVQDMLKKFDMESVRPATTPFEASKPKSKDEPDDAVNVHLYRSMIGSLMYLTASRPDIQFAVSACSRHQVTPLTSNLNAVKKIFKYLKGQPKLGLWYPRDSPFVLEAYSDSDYAGSHGDRKSTTGGCQFLGRRLISWQCKKQTIMATSSTEAEYVAAANCCGQVLWIQNQMLDYGFNFMNTKIFIDNQSTICIVKNPVFHQRTKHIEIRHHFIRDANEKNLIQVLKIHTDENVADLLTKAFDGPRFNHLVVHIGMLNP
ncbi:putative ribonuclease H-like domain-containing protein [Tanacetum coccineum]